MTAKINTGSSLSTILLLGGLLVLPLMLITDRHKVFWGTETQEIEYVLKERPRLEKERNRHKKFLLPGYDMNGYYVIGYGAYAQLKKNENLYTEFQRLDSGTLIRLVVPINDISNDVKRQKVVGLFYRNQKYIDPSEVSRYERKDFFQRIFLFVLFIIVGGAVKVVRYLKKRKSTV